MSTLAPDPVLERFRAILGSGGGTDPVLERFKAILQSRETYTTEQPGTEQLSHDERPYEGSQDGVTVQPYQPPAPVNVVGVPTQPHASKPDWRSTFADAEQQLGNTPPVIPGAQAGLVVGGAANLARGIQGGLAKLQNTFDPATYTTTPEHGLNLDREFGPRRAEDVNLPGLSAQEIQAAMDKTATASPLVQEIAGFAQIPGQMLDPINALAMAAGGVAGRGAVAASEGLGMGVIRNAAPRLAGAAEGAVGGAANLGTYSALTTPGEPQDRLEAGAKGAAMGAALGLGGAAVGAARDYLKLKAPELKSELETRGLPVPDSRKGMVEALRADDAKPKEPPNEAPRNQPQGGGVQEGPQGQAGAGVRVRGTEEPGQAPRPVQRGDEAAGVQASGEIEPSAPGGPNPPADVVAKPPTSDLYTPPGMRKPGTLATAPGSEKIPTSTSEWPPEKPPATPKVAEPNTTGIAHRVTTARGVDAPRGTVIDPEATREEGCKMLAAGADPAQIVADFNKTGNLQRGAFGVEAAKLEELAKATNKAIDEHGRDSTQAKAADQAEKDLVAAFKPLHTEWAQHGQAQQGETEIDTGTFHGLRRAYEGASGKEFAPAQAQVAKRTAGEVRAAGKALDAARAKLYETVAAPEAELSPRMKSIADRIVVRLDKAAADAMARFKARHNGTTLNVGIDPADFKDLSIYGAAKVAKGLTKFAEWSAEMTKEFGDKIKPHLKDLWDAADKHIDEHVAAGAGKKDAPAVRAKLAKADADLSGHVAGSKMTPERVKALWEKAKADYIEKGTTSFRDIVNGLATDLGLPADEIKKGLAQPKGAARLTNEMYARQAERNRVVNSAKQWVKGAATPGWLRFAKNLPRAFFTAKVAGHGTVGMVTHAGAHVFNPVEWRSYFTNFGRQFKLMSPAYHERTMEALQDRPNYITTRRAGLANDPAKYTDDYQTDFVAKALGKFGLAGNNGFDALKIFRQDLFDHQWDKLPASLKTPEMARMMADSINHSTGALSKAKMGGGVGAAVLFAPKLEGSRWAWLFGDPAKASKTFANWKNETPEARHAAVAEVKQKAVIAGTYFAALTANQAMLTATGSDQKINFTDPTAADWLAFKGGGYKFSVVSPLIGTVRFLANIAKASVGERSKLDAATGSRADKMAEVAGKYARGKLSPFASVVADTATQADYQGRPMPFSDDKLRATFRRRGIGKIGYGEYAAQTMLPIPFEESLHEAWHGQGADESTIGHWTRVVGVGALGVTGARATQENKDPKYKNK